MSVLIAKTPSPPYYAVIFTSLRMEGDHGYRRMSDRMVALAKKQPGFLGVESSRTELGITVSYWENEDAIRNWKQQSEHLIAQKEGKEVWYQSYRVRVCKVEREYGMERH